MKRILTKRLCTKCREGRDTELHVDVRKRSKDGRQRERGCDTAHDSASEIEMERVKTMKHVGYV